jgi:FtsZ-binding cell division protein ZapB
MAELIGTLTTIIGIAGKLRDLAKKIRDADAKNLIADLNLQLVDLKMQIAELREENVRLRGDVAEARHSQDLRSKVELRGKVYFLTEPVQGRPAGPYCSRCFDVDNKLVLVTELEQDFQVFGKYQCNNCKGFY